MDMKPKSYSSPLPRIPMFPEWAPEDVRMLGELWSSMLRNDNIKSDEIGIYR
jgi:hypothetical protein